MDSTKALIERAVAALRTAADIFDTADFGHDVRFETREVADALTALSEQGEAAQPAADWRTMGSAPKDGTKVDLWGINHLRHDKSGERIVNVRWGPVRDWMGNERNDWQHGRGEDFEPTHWMPLPASPDIASQAEEGSNQ